MSIKQNIIFYSSIMIILYLVQFILPPYPHLLMIRIMIFGIYASAYNLLLGFLGMISLGHAMYFGAGLYVTGLLITYGLLDPFTSILVGVVSSASLGLATAPILLRTRGPAFIITTFLTSLAFYFTIILFNDVTGGEQGMVLPAEALRFSIGNSLLMDFASPTARYNAALLGLLISILTSLLLYLSRTNTVLFAIKENEDRAGSFGYNTHRYKLCMLLLSSTLSGLSGSLLSVTSRYIGASLVSVNYSIMPLLWVLLGGQGTVLGPLIGAALLTVMIDVASSYLTSYLIIVGLSLVIIILLRPSGLIGSVRTRRLRL